MAERDFSEDDYVYRFPSILRNQCRAPPDRRFRVLGLLWQRAGCARQCADGNLGTHVFLASAVVPAGDATGGAEIEKYFDMSVVLVPRRRCAERDPGHHHQHRKRLALMASISALARSTAAGEHCRHEGHSSTSPGRTTARRREMAEFDWHEEPAPAGLPVRQVHGWLADETGRFPPQDRVHEQKFLLPGGQVGSGTAAGSPPCCGNVRRKARSGHPGQRCLPRPSGCYRRSAISCSVPAGPPFGVIESVGPAAPDPDSGYTYWRLMASTTRAACCWPGACRRAAGTCAALAGQRCGSPTGAPPGDSYIDGRFLPAFPHLSRPGRRCREPGSPGGSPWQDSLTFGVRGEDVFHCRGVGDAEQAHQAHRIGGSAGLVEDPVLAQLAGGDPGRVKHRLRRW